MLQVLLSSSPPTRSIVLSDRRRSSSSSSVRASTHCLLPVFFRGRRPHRSIQQTETTSPSSRPQQQQPPPNLQPALSNAHARSHARSPLPSPLCARSRAPSFDLATITPAFWSIIFQALVHVLVLDAHTFSVLSTDLIDFAHNITVDSRHVQHSSTGTKRVSCSSSFGGNLRQRSFHCRGSWLWHLERNAISL